MENLGTPIQVDIADIERELTRLWKSASDNAENVAVVRACSCNLIVLARDRAEAAYLLNVLASVAEFHPCRAVIAFCETSKGAGGEPAPPLPMRAWISAQCSLPFPGRPQVCSEVITLAARSEAASELPDTIASLLVPDLPVFIYWRSFDSGARDLMVGLARFARHLIVDSHAAKDDPLTRVRLLELLNQRPEGICVRDLNWARLTAWRDLIAQYFDHPEFAPQVHEICELEIFRDIDSPGSIPTRTLLLTGWLASRLGWQRIASERTGGDWVSRWRSKTGEVTVRFSGRLAEPQQPRGISSLTLRTRNESKFSAVREINSNTIKVSASGNGIQLSHSVPQDAPDEVTLLILELSLNGEDVGFQAALAEALALEKSFKS